MKDIKSPGHKICSNIKEIGDLYATGAVLVHSALIIRKALPFEQRLTLQAHALFLREFTSSDCSWRIYFATIE